MTWDCGLVMAPICDPRGRLWKYSSDSPAGSFSTVPSIRTCIELRLSGKHDRTPCAFGRALCIILQINICAYHTNTIAPSVLSVCKTFQCQSHQPILPIASPCLRVPLNVFNIASISVKYDFTACIWRHKLCFDCDTCLLVNQTSPGSRVSSLQNCYLFLKLLPVHTQCSKACLLQLPPFSAVVVGVEYEASLIIALEKHHPQRWPTLRV